MEKKTKGVFFCVQNTENLKMNIKGKMYLHEIYKRVPN